MSQCDISFVYQPPNPDSHKAPILVSAPHTGTAFPDSLKNLYHKAHLTTPEDADWHLDQLYNFLPSMGIGFIHSYYSRYVVDLNRDPKDQALYKDGRTLTSVLPSHSFSGSPLYKESTHFSDNEKRARIEAYHTPYHQELQKHLTELKQNFPQVLLFEAHSIKSFVPSLSPQPFPHFVIGDNDQRSCLRPITESVYSSLRDFFPEKNIALNSPFKGGYITRHYGRPEQGIQSLQLEMVQDNYMDEISFVYNPDKALIMQKALRALFQSLIQLMKEIH